MKLAKRDELTFQARRHGRAIDKIDSLAIFTGDRSERRPRRINIFRQFPHCTGGRIHNQNSDQAPKKMVSKIPAINVGCERHSLRGPSFFAEFNLIFSRREKALYISLSLYINVLSSDFGVWAIGGGLTQPIFQGGAIAGEIEVAKAEDKENLALLKKTVLAAFGEVEQALGAEHFFAQRESAAQQAAAVAIEAAERAGDEYSAGTGDILTLIDATRTKIENQSRYTAIRRMRLENRIDLHLALGGDFKAAK
jgi:hypothetical protein